MTNTSQDKNYIKLTAKPNTWFDEGTEVFNDDGKRFTIDEWNSWKESEIALFRGFVNDVEDGELCPFDEFNIEYNVEYAELTLTDNQKKIQEQIRIDL